MADEGYKRKLTTIFSTDAVGYSRLMGDDEAATVHTIELYRKIISDLISQYRGRVIDSPGDNLLAEFASVVDAVQCAVAVQKELQSRNAELAENRKMEFRIGINLGDVIEEGDRIYGDGVNIAARLESLSDPEGICISKTAFDHIETKLPLGYEYIGGQEVKNIVSPVETYKVIMDPRVTVAGRLKLPSNKVTRNIIWGAVAVLLLLAAIGIWQFYKRSPSLETAAVERMAYPLPDKPSIAVLPFDNLSGDTEQEYFSDGLTDDIIAALSRIPNLFVITRNSTFTYKGKPVKVQQVSEELGVRYVLEGSVKKSKDKIRVTAQLIDSISGHHLWANQYERNLTDIFAIQDEITKKIITAMQVQLTGGEQARVIAKGTDNLEAYFLVLKANDFIRRINIENNAMARQLAKEAIDLDPEYSVAYLVLADTHTYDFWTDPNTPQELSLAEAKRLLQKAIDLDDSYAEAYSHLGWVYTMERKNDKALELAQKALSLNPNSAATHFRLGKVLTFAGKPEASILEYKKAIRLNPFPPCIYFWSLGLSYAATQQYDEGIKWCEKAIQQEPDNLMARVMLTAIYGLAGRDREAQTEAIEVLRINPYFSLERFAKRAAPTITDALRKTGLK